MTTATTTHGDLGNCVAFFDRPARPQCPQKATNRRHLLCDEHLDDWYRATDARWSVTLHD